MTALMEITERPATVEPAEAPGPSNRPSGLRRAMPLMAMATGLVIMAVAALVVVGAPDGDQPRADPSTITLAARDVSVVTQVYEPGENSGWHAHPGIHAVAVLSGVLTVIDADCRTQTFEPGRPYVGGQEPHLVVNRTDAPVTMAVTYLSPAKGGTTEHMAAPAGC